MVAFTISRHDGHEERKHGGSNITYKITEFKNQEKSSALNHKKAAESNENPSKTYRKILQTPKTRL